MRVFIVLLTVAIFASVSLLAGSLDVFSDASLRCPPLAAGPPGAGKRVAVTPPEYAGTAVFHTLYLPPIWKPDGGRLPIIFEYTGNYFPQSGSSGRVEDSRLGFGLTGGRYIWVSLPYIAANKRQNEVTWWGDVKATTEYAKTNVPRILAQYQVNLHAVFLCGFSRGAIGVNFLGLHDDEIASLWTGFISHDHFDGVREWRGTDWGSPMSQYQAAALERLKRVGQRPYLVCQSGKEFRSKAYLESMPCDISNFRFLNVDTEAIFGNFPNAYAKSPHTDRWAYVPNRFRQEAWAWLNEVVRSATTP